MRTKQEIVENWLPRYTHRRLEDFGEYILLTNFNNYVELFAEECNSEVAGEDANMRSSSANGITIINFGMGSPNAAIVMDLLGAIRPKACLFLGKCGGIDKKNQLGDLILPIAAIRGEGTSNDYFPPEVPALPAFMLQRAVSSTIRDHGRDYWTGTVYTTNRRIWEHDVKFKEYLLSTRAMAVDMEQQLYSAWALPIIYQQGRCCWYQISQWFPRALRRKRVTHWLRTITRANMYESVSNPSA